MPCQGKIFTTFLPNTVDRRGKNRHKLLIVPREGLEPSRLAAQDPKSCVAASYTTSAVPPGHALGDMVSI